LDSEGRFENTGRKEDNMIIPSRRKLGAAALIIAGIGAFLVPFLLHSPSTQGTSSNNGGTNPNNGSHTTTPTPTTPTTRIHPGTKDDGKKKGGPEGTPDTGTCSDENSDHNEDVSDTNDLSVSHNAKDSATSGNSKGIQGHAYGLLKNQLDTTVALVKAMGTHNAAFHSHHDTKTDNDTVHTEHAGSESSNDNDSSCAEKEETNDD
jgi:hypothetical protein